MVRVLAELPTIAASATSSTIPETCPPGEGSFSQFVDMSAGRITPALAAARRAGTGRRPHAPRERLRLHRTQRRAAPGGRRLEQVWKV